VSRLAWWRSAALIAVALVAGCDRGRSGPDFLSASVEGPAALGAAVVEVYGSGIVSVQGSGSTQAFSAQLSEDVYRVVLVGAEAGSLNFRIEVRDPKGASVAGVLLSASDAADLPISSPVAFRVRVVR